MATVLSPRHTKAITKVALRHIQKSGIVWNITFPVDGLPVVEVAIAKSKSFLKDIRKASRK